MFYLVWIDYNKVLNIKKNSFELNVYTVDLNLYTLLNYWNFCLYINVCNRKTCWKIGRVTKIYYILIEGKKFSNTVATIL